MPELVVHVVGDTANLDKAFRRSSKEATKFSQEMHNAGRGVVSASASFVGLRRSMLSTSAAFIGGAGLAAAFTSTIDKAAAFQKDMNVLQAVSGATATEMARASVVARRLGADIRLPATSAADAAVAMLELSKGGLSVADTLGAARGTVQLAAAANIAVGDAATIAARQLNAFGLAGGQAGEVADILANTANVATGEIGDFALAFQQSSAVAHQFGLTMEDAAAALAEMANRGIVGSDAGTSLRVMLTRLVPQGAKAATAMKDLGIRFSDASGNLLPFRDQIVQYQKALAKLTPVQRQMAVQTIFGADAQRAANIIFGSGVATFDKMHEAVSRQGAAAKLSAAQNKGFTGAMDGLKSAIETTQISLGTLLLPTLTKYLRSSASWLGDTENQKRLQRDFGQVLEATGSALEAVVGVIRTGNAVFQKFADVVGSSEKAFAALALAIVGFKSRNAISGLTNIGFAAGEAGAAGQVALLRSRLLLLSRIVIPAIAIPIVIDQSIKGGKDPRVTGKPGSAQSKINKLPIVGTISKAFAETAVQITDAIGLTTKPQTKAIKDALAKQANDLAKGIDATHLKIDPVTGAVTTLVLGTAGKRVKAVKKAAEAAAAIVKAGLTGLASLTPEKRNAIALAAAELTKSTVDDLAALREQRRILAVQIGVTRKELGGASGAEAAKLADDLASLIGKDSQAFARILSINEAAAADAQTARDKVKAANEARRQAFADLLSGVTLGVDKGRLTVGQVNKAMTAREQAAKAIAAARHERAQFKALGLTGTGDEKAPTRKALLAQLPKIQSTIKGSILDTKANRSMLAGAARILTGGLGTLNRDVARKMQELFDTLAGKKAGGGPLTFTHALNLGAATAGLGLTAAQRSSLRARLAGQNLTTGSRSSEIHVHTTLEVDGAPFARTLTVHQARQGKREPTQTRGRQ